MGLFRTQEERQADRAARQERWRDSGPVRELLVGIGDGVRTVTGNIDEHIQGLVNNFTGQRDQENIEVDQNLAQDQFDYTRELNDLTMQREDTALQRQVADAEAAGINPMQLVAGGQMGSPTSGTRAPGGGTSTAKSTRAQPAQLLEAVTGLAQLDADLTLKKSQARLLDAQAYGQGMDNTILQETIDSRIKSIDANANVDWLNEQITRNNWEISNAEGPARVQKAAVDFYRNQLDAAWTRFNAIPEGENKGTTIFQMETFESARGRWQQGQSTTVTMEWQWADYQKLQTPAQRQYLAQEIALAMNQHNLTTSQELGVRTNQTNWLGMAEEIFQELFSFERGN